MGGIARAIKLRTFVEIVVVCGGGVVLQSVFELRASPQPIEWLLFAAAAIGTGLFSVKVASVPARLTVADSFFFAAALLYGPAVATLTVAVETFVVSIHRRHTAQRVAFNTTASALSIWAGSQVFFALAGVVPFAQAPAPLMPLIRPFLALTALYFGLNSGLTALAIGLDRGESPVQIWYRHFRAYSLTCLASSSVALCVIPLTYQMERGITLAIVPLLAVSHLAHRAPFARLERATRAMRASDLDRLYLSTVEMLAMAIDAKDEVTHSHVRRVQSYAVGLARSLGVTDAKTLQAIAAAALVHDMGKLAIPEEILNKPGKLTAFEFEIMKLHVDVGADILSLVDFPFPLVPIVQCHHENWDGTGYPRGIAGNDIPLGARILSVVDCFDALTSDRPYRARMTDEAAFEILSARRATMYDPLVVDTFIRIQPTISPADTDGPDQRQALQQLRQLRAV